MNRLDKMAESFRDHVGSSTSSWLVILLFIAVVVLLVALGRMFFSPQARMRRALLARFRLFAAASQLTREEANLFYRIAEYYQLENPAHLFIKRSVFEGAVQSLAIDPTRADLIRKKVYSA